MSEDIGRNRKLSGVLVVYEGNGSSQASYIAVANPTEIYRLRCHAPLKGVLRDIEFRRAVLEAAIFDKPFGIKIFHSNDLEKLLKAPCDRREINRAGTGELDNVVGVTASEYGGAYQAQQEITKDTSGKDVRAYLRQRLKFLGKHHKDPLVPLLIHYEFSKRFEKTAYADEAISLINWTLLAKRPLSAITGYFDFLEHECDDPLAILIGHYFPKIKKPVLLFSRTRPVLHAQEPPMPQQLRPKITALVKNYRKMTKKIMRLIGAMQDGNKKRKEHLFGEIDRISVRIENQIKDMKAIDQINAFNIEEARMRELLYQNG